MPQRESMSALPQPERGKLSHTAKQIELLATALRMETLTPQCVADELDRLRKDMQVMCDG